MDSPQIETTTGIASPTNEIRFSLVIPAYNEAAFLPRLLDTVDIARDRYRGGRDAIEVIVGNNASTDQTATIAAARGCKVAQVEERRIAAARNGGAALANGEFICFIDADSQIHPETFNAIERWMSTEKYAVGATSVVPDRWSLGIRVTFWIMRAMVWLMRMDAGVVFCRRADFIAVGGYRHDMHYAEDVQLLTDLKRLGRSRGQGFAHATEAMAVTSTRKFDKHGDWHFLLQMPLAGIRVLLDKRHANEFARRYWYDDR